MLLVARLFRHYWWWWELVLRWLRKLIGWGTTAIVAERRLPRSLLSVVAKFVPGRMPATLFAISSCVPMCSAALAEKRGAGNLSALKTLSTGRRMPVVAAAVEPWVYIRRPLVLLLKGGID